MPGAGRRGAGIGAPVVLSGVLSAVAFIGLVSAALAEPPLRDKSRYTLVDPTPPELRRPLAADRPDFTESPYTVDAGAVQLELSFVDYAKNGDADAWTVAPFNLKVGVLNDVDLQLVLDPWVHEDDGAESRDGPGDLQLRVKVNLWGNDAGASALALMPFVKIPTAGGDGGNGRVEGGLILPVALAVTDAVGLGLMIELDAVFDEGDDDYAAEVVTTAVVGCDVTERVGIYVEGIGVASTAAAADYRALLGFGATYALGPNLLLDAGTNLGLTGDADDVNLFTGMTVRF